jgi:hypothetical protein
LAEDQGVIGAGRKTKAAHSRVSVDSEEAMHDLLRGTTVSCTGLDITIACCDHDTKDALMNILTGEKANELVAFAAIWAVQYQKDYGLDGLHPTHYDLLLKHGARMDSFSKATNAYPLTNGER